MVEAENKMVDVPLSAIHDSFIVADNVYVVMEDEYMGNKKEDVICLAKIVDKDGKSVLVNIEDDEEYDDAIRAYYDYLMIAKEQKENSEGEE